jgi:archaellum component FlaC
MNRIFREGYAYNLGGNSGRAGEQPDLKKIEQEIDNTLSNETAESLQKFLDENPSQQGDKAIEQETVCSQICMKQGMCDGACVENSYSKEIEHLSNTIRERDAEIDLLKHDLEKLRTAYDLNVKNAEQRKQQIASLQSEIETLKGDAKQVHELVNKLSKECVFAERRKEQLQDELERVKGENAGIGNLLKASIERNQQCYSIEHIEQALHDNGLSRRGKLVVDNLKASKEGKGCE